MREIKTFFPFFDIRIFYVIDLTISKLAASYSRQGYIFRSCENLSSQIGKIFYPEGIMPTRRPTPGKSGKGPFVAKLSFNQRSLIFTPGGTFLNPVKVYHDGL